MNLHPGGTRIRLFPELYAGYQAPETVWLSPRPGLVRPGPADHQMYVVNAAGKTDAYQPPDSMPPYRGPEYAPAMPDLEGHFDGIAPGTPQFLAAHLYGAARHTLDIWEHYLRAPVTWWHVPQIPRLELIPMVRWPNAHCGPGFLETGIIRNDRHEDHLFCLNFDVVAHEIGHAVLFAVLGVPAPGRLSGEYLALHESFSDLFGLIGVLRFPSVVTRLLRQTSGNLHALNLVNRLGRYADNQQVRLAANAATMADVAGVSLRPDGAWDDPTGAQRNQHALGEPLTGAIFDMLAELFQDGIAARGLAPGGIDSRVRSRTHLERALPDLHRHHAATLDRTPAPYEAALRDARDVIGFGMAHVMQTLHPETLGFGRIAARMMEAASLMGERANLPPILDIFLRRGIDPRPFLRERGGGLHFVDDGRDAAPRTRDGGAFLHANRMVRHGHK